MSLCRLYLLKELSKNEEIFAGNVKYFMFKENLPKLTDYILNLYNKNVSSFIDTKELLKSDNNLWF